MARKPLTINAGQLELLASGEPLDVGGWNLPSTGGTENYVLVADVSGNGVWSSDLAGLTSLIVDNITIDGAAITSDTGAISINSSGVDTTWDCQIGDLDAILRIGEGAAGGFSILGGTSRDKDNNYHYQTYLTHNAYWDRVTKTWESVRTDLGRRFKFSMGYHQNSFTWNFSLAAVATITWTELMELDSSGNLSAIGTVSADQLTAVTITSDTGAISFDDEDLSTTGKMGVGTATLTGGQLNVKGSGNDNAVLGTELLTNGDFASDLSSWTAGTGWSWDASGKALHATGNIPTLLQSIAVTDGETYHVQFVMSSRTVGVVTLTLGGLTGERETVGNGTYYISFKATATTNLDLTFTPGSTFDGMIDSVSAKEITANSDPLLYLIDANTERTIDIRSTGGLTNLYIGETAGRTNTSGSYNVGLGRNSLYNNTTGYKNICIGYTSLFSNTTGYQNTAFGRAALYFNTTGWSNFAIGQAALYYNTSGERNVGIGVQALFYNTTGSVNVAIGSDALKSNTEGDNNVAIGYLSLFKSTLANANTAIGKSALYAVTLGSSNIGLGAFTMPVLTEGNYNTGIASYALRDLTTGSNNTGIGYNTGRSIATGDSNTIIGANVAGLAADLANNIIIADGDGVERIWVDSSGHVWLPADNQNLVFGAGKDVLAYYDGTDFIIDSGAIAPSDIILDCGTEKTLELAEVVWNDIFIPLAGAKVPASNTPSWDSYSTNLNSYTFAIDDYADLATAEILHDWKEGTDLQVHVHFITDGANDGTARKVKYQVFYSIGDGAEVMAAEANLSDEEDIIASEADKMHHRLTVGAITGTNYKIGALLKIRVKRITGTGTEPANDPFVEMIGVHYQIDTLGSRQETVK